MKNLEKNIIRFSILVLVVVIVWAVVINLNKKIYGLKIKSTSVVTNVTKNETTVNNIKTSNHTRNVSNSVSNATAVKMKNNDQGVPILMYHSISDDTTSNVQAALRISNKNFAEQMKYLKDNNYTTLTMDELNDFLQNNKAIPDKSVVLTFDDGYEDNYTNVYPVLKQDGFKATIFVETSYIDANKNYLTSAQLKELQMAGMDIESGADENDRLGEMYKSEQLDSINTSKQYLEKLLNKKINYISYPFGSYNTNTLDAVSKAGYVLGLSRDGKWAYKTDGFYKLSRVYIGPNHTEADFEKRINNPNY